MDCENTIVEEIPNSLCEVDQVDNTFLKKILARKSVNEQSMQMLDTENVVSVPFNWEMRPGTPRHPQSETRPPSIKPCPAVQSQTLVIPDFASYHTTVTLCFWIKSRKKHRQGKKIIKGNAKGRQGCACEGNDVFVVCGEGNRTSESVELSGVNVDSLSLSDHSRSCSTSSASTSSSNNSSSGSSNSSSFRRFAKGLIKLF
ncbi:hypothetical protein V6N13_113711 [Hibiscus sabdariffa]|uniref:Uncharacterized protein n=1 Tax=Hibiscus sabdariffa TaxID=183260 RepID=A0ABR2TZM9_9ROSI